MPHLDTETEMVRRRLTRKARRAETDLSKSRLENKHYRLYQFILSLLSFLIFPAGLIFKKLDMFSPVFMKLPKPR